MIGFEIKNGYLRSLNSNTLTYDNKFLNIDYRTCDDEPLMLPEGKFLISRKDKLRKNKTMH